MFDTTPQLDCAGHVLLLDRPRILGIVNVTPDSFSDGGQHVDLDAAIAHGLVLAAEGADGLDIGGESTRPGAAEVSVEEELHRVIPVIERLARETSLPISVDTSKPEVMRAAVAAGAGMINDVYALRRDGALDAAAELGVPVVLMHMQGDPRTMQVDPHYDDVVAEVHRFLADRIFACEMSGISRKHIVIDPGFGFGKSLDHNLTLLRQLARFTDLGVPVLAGLSRKSMLGALIERSEDVAAKRPNERSEDVAAQRPNGATGRGPRTRVHASVAAAVIAAHYGARLIRVHDVAATVDALKVWTAVAAQAVPKKSSAGTVPPRWSDDD